MATPQRKRKSRRHALKKIQQPEGMKAAALATSKRRGNGTDHTHVVGHHTIQAGEIKLRCIATNRAYTVLENTLTTTVADFARWRTKQAANQWLQRRPGYIDLHVYSLDALDVTKLA